MRSGEHRKDWGEPEEITYIKSDYCTECDGSGRASVGTRPVFNHKSMEIFDADIMGQCESCEDLHRQELLADRLEDAAKGN